MRMESVSQSNKMTGQADVEEGVSPERLSPCQMETSKRSGQVTRRVKPVKSWETICLNKEGVSLSRKETSEGE